MPSKEWYSRPKEEREVLLEAIRLYFVRHTTKLSLRVAMKLDDEGLIRIVWIDTRDPVRAWIAELTPLGMKAATQFFLPDEDPPDAATDEPHDPVNPPDPT